VDGTLIDTTTLIAESLDHVYRKHFGREMPFDSRRALIGMALWKQVRVFGEPEAFGVSAETVMDDFITHYEANKHQERILTDVIELLIEGKQRGLRTALVTSKNHEELANTLPRLGIADYVDFAVTADDVQNPKPDPEGIRLALSHFAIPAERIPDVVYIGDTAHDMIAARGAGVRGVGVLWGAGTRPVLEAETPFRICETPEDLRRVLFPVETASP
jgi:pyrophosphatase PpaX